MTARRYAEKTDVPAERTQMEIKRLVEQYGASGFVQGWHGARAGVIFEMQDRRVRFMMALPDEGDLRYSTRVRVSPTKDRARTKPERQALWAQDVRSLWRALFLTIKAKLVSVESGVEQFEEAFLAQIVLPDDSTYGDFALPQIEESYRTGQMPPMLPGQGRAPRLMSARQGSRPHITEES